ncbi:cupin domain-containing protein [Conexibacter woesei]|uniref:Cupin 2 conserved barrel domain protein n=1 Tax=Conexibacter woesei (strain DSM 14684 / CCUG 47730 / CIP 108061 / JCM 11494 / NBRC 100937 / ID131577) TaxID=469383 RepID=D3F950_CONWI|nr:cupin domain-containing protein [Conexibacter woesei]ADB53045.1 Cupin 2 conserved barrel domain protein [Conexibacter woesei DSM 14684]
MPHATLADAPTFERPGFTFRPLAVPSRGSVELAVWALEIAPGAVSESHSVSREEVFVLGSGAVAAVVGGSRAALAPGDALIVPPGVELTLSNDGETAARLTVCTSAGMLGTVGGRTFPPPWAA